MLGETKINGDGVDFRVVQSLSLCLRLNLLSMIKETLEDKQSTIMK